MDFDNYASRILTIEEAKESGMSFAKNQKQTRFQNKNGHLNDKRYILPAVSVPFSTDTRTKNLLKKIG